MGKKGVDIEIYIDSILGLTSFVHDAGRKIKHMKTVESKMKTNKVTKRNLDAKSTTLGKT